LILRSTLLQFPYHHCPRVPVPAHAVHTAEPPSHAETETI
jgi:hypothetical protein